jgi:hypothetical protein
MEDEVCECVVEGLLQGPFFASKKKIIETDRPAHFLTKMVKHQRTG